MLRRLYEGNTYLIFEGRIHNWIFLLDGGVRFVLTLASAYSLSFPVILVKIVRTVMVTSIFGRSVSIPDPYAEPQFLKRHKKRKRNGS